MKYQFVFILVTLSSISSRPLLFDGANGLDGITKLLSGASKNKAIPASKEFESAIEESRPSMESKRPVIKEAPIIQESSRDTSRSLIPDRENTENRENRENRETEPELPMPQEANQPPLEPPSTGPMTVATPDPAANFFLAEE
ncbi:hypothetical protein K502DRAFT_326855 [Neoconidiobolus thromboides FSU 785]|nr:hypothetical protein K502DRAFT_326855 [Neoconidiobolus thromboides FSU 785]